MQTQNQQRCKRTIKGAKSAPLRQGFQPGGFRIVLVGKDGGIKLEQEEVLDPETLFSLIDGMPMRRNEMAN